MSADSPAPTHYTVTLTREQMVLVRDAVEACSRFMMGQADDVAFRFLMGRLPIERFCELRDRLQALGPLVTGEQPHVSKYPTPEAQHIGEGLFLIYQTLRQPLYLDHCAAEGREPGWVVSGDDPFPVAGWEMPQIYAGKVEGTPWTKP